MITHRLYYGNGKFSNNVWDEHACRGAELYSDHFFEFGKMTIVANKISKQRSIDIIAITHMTVLPKPNKPLVIYYIK